MVTLQSNAEMTAEFLQAIQEKYNINFDDVQDYMNEKKRQQILEQHPWNIWLAEDGRYKTWVQDEKKPKGKRLIAKSTREKVEYCIVEEYLKSNQEKKVKYTVEYVFEKWIEYAVGKKDIEKNTRDRYRNDFDKYILGTELASMEIEKIDRNTMIDFLKDIVNEHYITKKIYGNIKTVLNGIFSYAMSRMKLDCISLSYILKDFKLSDKKFRKVIMKDEEQVYSDDEALQMAHYIIDNFTTTRELGILLTLLTGLRSGELATLKYTDQDNNLLYVLRTEIKHKNENGRTVYEVRDFPKTETSMDKIILTDSAVKVLSLIRELNEQNGVTSEYLFYEKKYGRLNSYFFNKTLKKICNALGIPFRSMHKLRKTYASYLLASGVEKKIAQKQLRHKDSRTTDKYYDYFVRSQEYAIEELNKKDILSDKLKSVTQCNPEK